jgi:protein pelota
LTFTTSTTELNQLSGVAAILTFPLDVEAVEEEERVLKEEAESGTQQSDGEEPQ